MVNTDRQKLSKRSMDIGIDSYKQAGIPPPALLNFAALLGWNPGNSPNKGVMTLDDMVDNVRSWHLGTELAPYVSLNMADILRIC